MPPTVEELFGAASLGLTGRVQWSAPILTNVSSVYVVSLSSETRCNDCFFDAAQIDIRQEARRAASVEKNADDTNDVPYRSNSVEIPAEYGDLGSDGEIEINSPPENAECEAYDAGDDDGARP